MPEFSPAEQRAVQHMAEVLQVDAARLSPTTVAVEIAAWDSMALIEMVFMLQREYDITLSVQQATGLTSVAAVLKVIRDAGKLK